MARLDHGKAPSGYDGADGWEARYRELFRHMASGVAIYEPVADGADFIIRDLNPAAERINRVRREDVIGRRVTEAFPAVKTFGLLDVFQEVHRTGRPAYHPVNYYEDGRLAAWFENHVYRLPSGEIVAVHDDVSARVLADEALRERERQLANLIRNIPGLVFRCRHDARRTMDFISEGCLRLTGYRAEDLLGSRGISYEEMILPDDRPRVRREVEQALAEQRQFTVEYRIRHADGSVRWVIERGAGVFSPDGVVEAVEGVINDIIPRKTVEAALVESETCLRHLFDEAPVGYHEIDVEGRIARVNRTECEMLGYEPSDMVGRFAWEFVENPEESRRRVLAKLSGSTEIGKPYERSFRRKDGSLVPVILQERVLRDAANRIVGIRTTCQDITERKQAEERQKKLDAQIQHTQKLESLGVLAGGIAHDFNNLLMGILGYADLALLELPAESPARGSVRQIQTAAQRASELTRQMLAYSGKGRFVIEPVDLSRLVEETTHLLEVAVTKKAVLKYKLAPNLPAIQGDAGQIRQVVMNLITNASDAIGDKSGMISIITGVMECDRAYLSGTFPDESLPPGRYVYLEVSDTGCGMDEETRARIFDPFFTTKFAGRGLGLAAVLGICRGHGGAIKVYSEPGRGSTFKVLFPASDAPASRRGEAPADAPSWRCGGWVLVVDDDETVRTLAGQMLERLGFQIITAADGEDALRLFRERAAEIRLVLLDMTMPHMGGEETFREMRRVRPDVRVILSSGYNEQEAISRFAGKGLAGFIQKPYQIAQLVEKLREVLGEPAQPA